MELLLTLYSLLQQKKKKRIEVGRETWVGVHNLDYRCDDFLQTCSVGYAWSCINVPMQPFSGCELGLPVELTQLLGENFLPEIF